jgi:hypothetical protein|tara:strand:- start:129 stop:377 length:249 start_codon:yes stop_codon:yes gene_type:complete
MSNITLTNGTIDDITDILGRHLAPAIEDQGSICEVDYDINISGEGTGYNNIDASIDIRVDEVRLKSIIKEILTEDLGEDSDA